MMFWYRGGWAWWQAGLMWLAVIAFWVLLIWAICALVTRARRSDQEPPGGQPGKARGILDERLARGEIDAEEYLRLRDLLDSGDHSGPDLGARGDRRSQEAQDDRPGSGQPAGAGGSWSP